MIDPIQALYDLSRIGGGINEEPSRRGQFKACLVNGHVLTEERSGFCGGLKEILDRNSHSKRVYRTISQSLESILLQHFQALGDANPSPLGLFTNTDVKNIRTACTHIESSHRENSKREGSLLHEFLATTARICSMIEELKTSNPIHTLNYLRQNCTVFPEISWGRGSPFPSNPTEALKALLRIKSTGNNLGEGSYGFVTKWKDDQSNFYAVKLFKTQDETYRQFNKLEKGEISALFIDHQHPHILKTYALLLYNPRTRQYSVINNKFQIPIKDRDKYQVKAVVSELVEGEQLLDALGQEKVLLGLDTAIKIGKQVSNALAYLHSQELVYRDLKTENLMIDSNGNIKLIDFGFCKRVAPTELTSTFCGNPAYVSPEMLQQRPYDNRVDSWALGSLLIQLVTKYTPAYFATGGIQSRATVYSKGNIQRFAEKNDDDKKTYLKRIDPTFSTPNGENLLDIIVALTKKNPNERISCEEAHSRLTALLPLTETIPSRTAASAA